MDSNMSNIIGSLLPLIVLFAIFYFVMIKLIDFKKRRNV